MNAAGNITEAANLGWALLILGIAAGAFIGLFAAGRAFILWYFRIDRIIELLETMARKLPGKDIPTSAALKCPRCSAELPASGADSCPKCHAPFKRTTYGA